MNKLDIFILTNKKKKCLTEQYLSNINYQIYKNQDWDLPSNFKPRGKAKKLRDVIEHQLGQFRCYRGHQEILKRAKKDYILVFEDDAIPNENNWQKLIEDALELLDKYDVVSLHARKPKRPWLVESRIKHKNKQYVKIKVDQKSGFAWALGSLCYLISKNKAQKIINEPYKGVPMDLYLYTYYNTIIMYPSCFNHDCSNGTLIG